MSTGKIELSVGAVKIGNKYEIFTEEEIDAINNKIPELDGRVGVIEDEIEEINSSLDTMESEKNNEFFNLNNLKKLDYDIDDTDRIQRALDYCVENNLTLLIPHGKYIVSKKGVKNISYGNYNLPYCIYKENAKVKIVVQGEIQIDFKVSVDRANIFHFENCEVMFEGGYFKAIHNTNKQLLIGGAIHLNLCKNSIIEKVYSENMNGCITMTSCKNVLVKESTFKNSNLNMASCGAGFGIYQGDNNEFNSCVTYGGTGDGDITLFGDGKNNRVVNCKLYNSLEDLVLPNRDDIRTNCQGICVDSGQNNCFVSGNYVYGFFYGIDVKTNIINCLVSNNIVERSKFSYALRLGERNSLNVYSDFIGNQALNLGNGNEYSLYGYQTVGFLIQGSFSGSIKNNTISLDPNYRNGLTTGGIVVSSSINGSNDGYINDINIIGNTFNNEVGLGASISSYNMVDVDITIGSKNQNINIINNNFTGGYGSKTNPFIKVNTCNLCNIKNNEFGRIDCDGAIIIGDIARLYYKNNINGYSKTFIKSTSIGMAEISNNNIGGLSDYKNFFSGSATYTIMLNNVYFHSGTGDGTLCSVDGQLIAQNNIIRPFTDRGAANNYFDTSGTTVSEVNNIKLT